MFSFVKSAKLAYLYVFLTGAVFRGIPEIIVPQYPVGFETITYYAPAMIIFSKRSLIDIFVDAFQVSSTVSSYRPLLDTFRAGPFFYILMWLTSIVSSIHVYLILKVVGPLLYGFLAVSFFVFLNRGLNFERKKAFVGTLVLVFQIAALRESWDRFRTVLSLIFLFATLTTLKSESKYKWWLVAIFGTLTALSREYVTLVLFVTVLGFVIVKDKDKLIPLAALAPALIIFTAMAYPALSWWNFLSPNNPFNIRSYPWLLQDVFSIFAVCYLPILPLVVNGFKRDDILDPMVSWLLLGSFSIILSPLFAVPGYQRWLMLLVFPFSVYAVNGFEHFHLFNKDNFKKLLTILLIFAVIGIGYSSGAFSYVVLPNSWVPTNLVQSSIAWDQVDDVKGVLLWLDENAITNSCILCEERFYGWTLIYLERANNDVEIIPYGANSAPTAALEKALNDDFSKIYLIWYVNSSFENFQVIYSLENVAIFQYEL